MIRRLAFVLLMTGLMPVFAVNAQTISPTRLVIALDQEQQATLTLTATQSTPQALELRVLPYQQSSKAGTAAASIPLSVTPPQVLLQPGQTRQVRIDWRGAASLEASRSFWLEVEELGLSAGAQADPSEINLLTTFRVPVHVHSGGAPQLQVEMRSSHEADAITLHNAGNRFAHLANYTLTASGRKAVPGLEIARALNRDALLPQESVTVLAESLGFAANAGALEVKMTRREAADAP